MSAQSGIVASAPAQDVQSPCINVCRMNDRTGLCEGCLRTLDEIARWSSAARDEKLAIIAQLDARRRSLAP